MPKAGHILAAAIALLAAGCLSSHSSIGTDTSPLAWDRSCPAVLRFENSDTLSERDISLQLRCACKIAEDTVLLMVSIQTPEGHVACDTLPVALRSRPESNGISEQSFILHSAAVLSEAGEYRFEIWPLRRLKGIWGVGLDFS